MHGAKPLKPSLRPKQPLLVPATPASIGDAAAPAGQPRGVTRRRQARAPGCGAARQPGALLCAVPRPGRALPPARRRGRLSLSLALTLARARARACCQAVARARSQALALPLAQALALPQALDRTLAYSAELAAPARLWQQAQLVHELPRLPVLLLSLLGRFPQLPANPASVL